MDYINCKSYCGECNKNHLQNRFFFVLGHKTKLYFLKRINFQTSQSDSIDYALVIKCHILNESQSLPRNSHAIAINNKKSAQVKQTIS
jgi:hypothetical protein